MHKLVIILWALGVTCLLSACVANFPTLAKSGSLPSPGDSCVALLGVSPNGGYLTLDIKTDHNGRSTHAKPLLNDVTGIGWLNRTLLIASVSPIYGKPGIYSIDCETMNITQLVSPRHIDKGYPAGTDYFELKNLSNHGIVYYYGDDVDQIDFTHFRTERFERRYDVP